MQRKPGVYEVFKWLFLHKVGSNKTKNKKNKQQQQQKRRKEVTEDSVPFGAQRSFSCGRLEWGCLSMEKNVLACGNEVKKKTAMDDSFSPSRLLYPHKLRQWSAW
jgi:hypothetical protein